jgi:predicted phosphoribosyltransferase
VIRPTALTARCQKPAPDAARAEDDREVVRVLLDESMRFANRREAGKALGEQVAEHLQCSGWIERPLVLGLPRGGVPVAAEVARVIGGDLDVVVVAKVGAPWRPEFGVGALGENGPAVMDQDALTRFGISSIDLAPAIEQQRVEIGRQLEHYRGKHPAPVVEGRVVVVIDDGMTTGITARAALRGLRRGRPAHLVYATPVCAAESCDALRVEADALVHVRCPCCFSAFGLWYRDFSELSDAEVLEMLSRAWSVPTPG